LSPEFGILINPFIYIFQKLGLLQQEVGVLPHHEGLEPG
jgi:hypothetical protein